MDCRKCRLWNYQIWSTKFSGNWRTSFFGSQSLKTLYWLNPDFYRLRGTGTVNGGRKKEEGRGFVAQCLQHAAPLCRGMFARGSADAAGSKWVNSQQSWNVFLATYLHRRNCYLSLLRGWLTCNYIKEERQHGRRAALSAACCKQWLTSRSANAPRAPP